MTTTTLMPGQVVWTKGANEFGDDRIGGMYIKTGHDPETGEAAALVLTYQAAKPRQCSVLLVNPGGGTRPLGLVARLIRVPLSDIVPPADGFREWDKCAFYAKKALQAATLPPCDDIDSKRHVELVDAWRILRDEAVMLRRGVT